MGMAQFVTVLIGGYDDIGAAMRDFAQLKQLHEDKSLGAYEAALVKKELNGEVVAAETTASKRREGAGIGAVAGGIVGVLFPPSIIGASIVGSLAGTAIGGSQKSLKRRDFKELGGLLQEGRSGIVVVADDISVQALKVALHEAQRTGSTTVEADADQIKAAIVDAVEMDAAARL